MIPVNTDTTHNAAAFLLALHNRIKAGESANVVALIAKHKLPQYTSKVLQEGGIVTSTGAGRYTSWTWNTIVPSDQMAVEFIKRLNNFKSPDKPKKELAHKVTRRPLETAKTEPTPIEHDKNCVETAIDLLKSMGYKVMKPTFIEV